VLTPGIGAKVDWPGIGDGYQFVPGVGVGVMLGPGVLNVLSFSFWFLLTVSYSLYLQPCKIAAI
jgi:hypothetical protein